METKKIKLVIGFNYYENLKYELGFKLEDLAEENLYEKFENISTEVLDPLLDKSIDAIYFSPGIEASRPYFMSWCNIEKNYIFESSLSFYDKVEYDKFMKTLEENGWILKYSKKHDVKKGD